MATDTERSSHKVYEKDQIGEVQIADEVTLVGTDGAETITVEDVSNGVYRFNYEFCCLITPRVPRVYIKEGKVIE